MQARDLLGNLVREVEALREELRRANFNREVARQSVSLTVYVHICVCVRVEGCESRRRWMWMWVE